MLGMKTKHVTILSVAAIVIGIGIYRFARFARDYPQEATWGVVFYGMIFVMIAVPVGIIALIVRGLSKRGKPRVAAQQKRASEDENHTSA